MLTFCYTDDYDDGSGSRNQVDHQSLIGAVSQIRFEADPTSPAAIGEQGRLEQHNDTSLSSNGLLGGNDTEENAGYDFVWEGLMNNALVYAIADKYAIHPLKALAKEKFKALTKKGLPCDFSHIIQEVFDSTPPKDSGLRDLVVDKCMVHLDVLLEEEAFEALLHEKAELGCILLQREHKEHNKLIKLMTDLVESYKTRNDAQNRELESVRNHGNTLQLLLDNRERTLKNTPNCRGCGSSFNCVFRTGESLLRCATCSTKHYL